MLPIQSKKLVNNLKTLLTQRRETREKVEDHLQVQVQEKDVEEKLQEKVPLEEHQVQVEVEEESLQVQVQVEVEVLKNKTPNGIGESV